MGNAVSPSISRDSVAPPAPVADATPVSLLDISRERLRNGEFEAVMAEFADVQAGLSASEATAHRQLILDHVEELRQADQLFAARALLKRYLEYEYSDVTALLLLARIHQQAGEDMEAIEAEAD